MGLAFFPVLWLVNLIWFGPAYRQHKVISQWLVYNLVGFLVATGGLTAWFVYYLLNVQSFPGKHLILRLRVLSNLGAWNRS